MVLAEVGRRVQQRVGHRHHVQEGVLRQRDALVHVRRRELNAQLTVDEVVAHALAPMRRVRVHAQDLDLAVHRLDARADLVERRDHVVLGVAPHRASERVPRHPLDRNVDEGGACVGARNPKLEHVEHVAPPQLRWRRLETCHLVLECATAHLGCLAPAAAMLSEEPHVLEGDQLLIEGAL